MDIVFSVITCTYNAAQECGVTFDNVLAQTYGGVEHIIVDGASADGTMDLARAYKERSDARDNGHSVVLVSEPDRGLYDAMNKGLALATGTYVLFLNAGDLLPGEDTLQRVAARAGLEAVRPGVLYGDTDVVDADGHFLRHRELAPPDRLTWRSFRQGMLVCHQAFYARTDLARCTPYDLRYRYSADVDWCIRVMREAEREEAPLCRVDGVVALFRDGGLTTAHHRDSLRERFRVMQVHYGLPSTVAMHLWFVVRQLWRRLHRL